MFLFQGCVIVNKFSDILVPCPYGEVSQNGVSCHREPPPQGFPCTGFHEDKAHVVRMSDWMKWVSDQLKEPPFSVDGHVG